MLHSVLLMPELCCDRLYRQHTISHEQLFHLKNNIYIINSLCSDSQLVLQFFETKIKL